MSEINRRNSASPLALILIVLIVVSIITSAIVYTFYKNNNEDISSIPMEILKKKSIVKIGSVKITVEEFQKKLEDEINKSSGDYKNKLKTTAGQREFLETMIEQKLLYFLADNDGHYATNKEILNKIEEYKMSIMGEQYYKDKVLPQITLKTNELVDEEIRDYYERHKNKFVTPPKVKVRHILCRTKDEALYTRWKLTQGYSFESMAMERSLDLESARKGGSLGVISRDGPFPYFANSPAFIDTAFSIEVGKPSYPVETPKGFHIILVDEKIPQSYKPLTEAYSEIKEYLKDEILKEKKKEVYNKLKKKAGIKINDAVYKRVFGVEP